MKNMLPIIIWVLAVAPVCAEDIDTTKVSWNGTVGRVWAKVGEDFASVRILDNKHCQLYLYDASSTAGKYKAKPFDAKSVKLTLKKETFTQRDGSKITVDGPIIFQPKYPDRPSNYVFKSDDSIFYQIMKNSIEQLAGAIEVELQFE